jgi:hypothetical protein
MWHGHMAGIYTSEKEQFTVSYFKYSGVVSVLVFLPMVLTGQRAQQNVVPLKNWATPLYWQANQTERGAAGGALPQLQFSANQISADALTFIAITPCRLVDTRGGAFNGISPFSGPSIAAMGTITIPVQSMTEANTNTMPAPCGVIPSTAQAYSFNLTVVPKVLGTPVDYVSLWPAGGTQPFVSTLDDPQGAIVSNAAIVPAGTPTGGINVYNPGPATTDVMIDMNGYYTAPTDTNLNTAIGAGTLASNTTGNGGTATGANALKDNTVGFDNTATGISALALNTTGSDNTATGAYALEDNTTGYNNTADGFFALQNNTTGINSTAVGVAALVTNSTGSYNIALGFDALQSNRTGSSNIGIGFDAALYALDINSNSIYIGNQGTGSDTSGTIAIGTQGTQTATFIAGISGASAAGGVEVFVNGNGRLGTTLSSRRFKEDITDMGDTSSKLFQLRPVTFHYKPEYDDGSHLLQYGLIAEEVEKVYPEMVAYGNDGQILTVKYQMLAPMLLNEVQKQNARAEKLEDQNRKQAGQIHSLEDRLAALEALLSTQAPAARPASSQ